MKICTEDLYCRWIKIYTIVDDKIPICDTVSINYRHLPDGLIEYWVGILKFWIAICVCRLSTVNSHFYAEFEEIIFYISELLL